MSVTTVNGRQPYDGRLQARSVSVKGSTKQVRRTVDGGPVSVKRPSSTTDVPVVRYGVHPYMYGVKLGSDHMSVINDTLPTEFYMKVNVIVLWR